MKHRTFGVGGRPLAGKRETLIGLARINSAFAMQPYRSASGDRMLHFTVSNEEYQLEFYTSTGAVFYDRKVYAEILSKAEAVVYVFSASPKYEMESEVKVFKTFTRIAQEKGKLWTDIPWIVVVNEIWPDAMIPQGVELPSKLLNSVIQINAYKAQVSELWQRMIEIC